MRSPTAVGATSKGERGNWRGSTSKGDGRKEREERENGNGGEGNPPFPKSR